MDEIPSPTGLSGGAMVVPVAAIGALSQAWFDALGLARPPSPLAAPKAVLGAALPVRKATLPAAQRSTVTHAVLPSAPIARKTASFERARCRVAHGLQASNRITRTWRVLAAHPILHDVAHRSAGRITIRSKRGIITMLVQRELNRMRITAVCDPALISKVSDALTNAHRQLRARSIALEIHTYQEKKA